MDTLQFRIAPWSVKGGSMRTERHRAMPYSEYMRQRHERVTALAHQRWLLRGCPEGTPEVDWFSAELEFDQQFLAGIELGKPA